MRSPLASLLLLALLLLLVPAGAQADAAPRAPAELAAALEAVPIRDTGHAFLWEITSARKAHRGRLFVTGSVHAGRPDFYPLPRVVDAAFEGADALVVELDLTRDEELLVDAAAARAALPEGQTLSGILGADAPGILAQLAAHGIPAAAAERLTPLVLAVALQMGDVTEAGWDPAYGLDRHFLARAAQAGRPVVELEGAEEQIEMLFGMPIEEQVAMLEQTLSLAGLGPRQAERFWEAICAGDGDALSRLGSFDDRADDPASRGVTERLLGARNRAMTADLLDHVRRGQGTWFVVVGALHVAGAGGIIDLLDDKRFLRVRQVERGAPAP